MLKMYLIYLCYLLTLSCAFNLEPRLTIVKQGSADSYFGYSIAEHQEVDDLGQVTDGWILVGAPLDQNLQPGTNRSGALWKCPLTTQHRDCIQVVTDGRRAISSGRLRPPGSDEIKDGQWLGVTVRSQGPGKKVLVCAHRYIRKGVDYQWGQGLCYTLSQELEYDEAWEPCRGRPTNWAHEQFGYCQAGTSGALLNDDTIIFGSPGPYTWRGTLFVTSVAEDFLKRDKQMYYAPVTADQSPMDKYSYLGMSVTGGKFFSGTMAYAAGAPRANGTGQVVLVTKPTRDAVMNIRLVLSGEQFASSFGYELETADINGDGIHDLLVGAPFYHGKDTGGAVYIFQNTPEGFTEYTPYTKLTGKPESRFGISISNMKDMNMDGFDDVAIGAPFEDRGVVYIYLGSKDGIIPEPSQIIRAEDIPGDPPVTFGAALSAGLDLDRNGYPDLLVGAYEEAKTFLIMTRPIIGITTSVLSEENLKNVDPNRKGCEKYPNATEVCFTFKPCLKIESIDTTKPILEVRYRIEAETYKPGKKFSRVRFANGHTDRSNVVEKVISFLDKTEPSECLEETVFLKENTKDIQTAIGFKMTYTLVQREPGILSEGDDFPLLSHYPILNQQEAAKTFFATFEKDCGNNDICESELQVSASLNLPLGNDGIPLLELGDQPELLLEISVANLGEPAYEAGLFVEHSRGLSFVGRIIEGNKISCNLYNATLVTCSLGNPFKKESNSLRLRFSPGELGDRIEFKIWTNTTSDEQSIQGDLELEARVVKRAEVSVRGLGRPEQVFYGGEIRGESAIKFRDEIGPQVLHSFEVFNGGPWRVPHLSLIISWPYQAENHKEQGKWLLYMEEKPFVDGDGECLMDPGQVNNLKLKRRPGAVETPLEHLILQDSPAPLIDFVNATESGDSSLNKRRRRDLEEVVRAEAIVDKDGTTRHVVTMDCDKGTAKCFKFRCNVRNLQRRQSAVIKIRARLWNSTLAEDYMKADRVVIRSKARIELDPFLEINQSNTVDDIDYAETIAYPDHLDTGESKSIPIWIILLAVAVGVFLLNNLRTAAYKAIGTIINESPISSVESINDHVASFTETLLLRLHELLQMEISRLTGSVLRVSCPTVTFTTTLL
ncbi:integrin alpha-PS1-like isoform X2 [Artemia franciscana]|uniref:integrin alpha-PS1-like isoform X2 n=1 Tax=Artemia franciscana TaxID=6661 RepID=UPI0032DA70E7